MSGLQALYGARLRGRAKWILNFVKVGSYLPEFTSRPLGLLTIPQLRLNCAYLAYVAGAGPPEAQPPGSPTFSGSNERRQVAGAAPVNGASGRPREIGTRGDKRHLIGHPRLRPQIRPSRLAGVRKCTPRRTCPIQLGAATDPLQPLALRRHESASESTPDTRIVHELHILSLGSRPPGSRRFPRHLKQAPEKPWPVPEVSRPTNTPLTLNSLVSACNQKSTRHPVVNMTLGEVGHVVNQLRDRGLIQHKLIAYACIRRGCCAPRVRGVSNKVELGRGPDPATGGCGGPGGKHRLLGHGYAGPRLAKTRPSG
ncbi:MULTISPECIES: DUF480 domain-containing protein [unclassified Thiocapsa]|uniref:DUF480 domain-containing protein n=1 Tax=unclassified Thiocapsa TaxID=2641286 RepID=UPI0035B201F8